MANEDVLIKAKIKLEGFENINKVIDRLNLSVRQAGPRFAGYALSILFFGQALQRTFTSISRFGIKTFTDVMHSVEGTVTQSDMLNASMAYLGFAIGAALEPVLGWLIPWIDKLAVLIQEHPKLTAAITATGIALGAIFSIGGAGILAVNGFIELAMKLGLVSTNAEGAITSVSKLKSALSTLGGVIAIGLAFKQATDAFADFKKGDFGDGLFNAISSGLMLAGGAKLLKGAKGGGWLIALGFAVDKAANGDLFEDTFRVIGVISAAYKAGFDVIIQAFKNMKDVLSGRGASGNKSFSDFFRQNYEDVVNAGKQLDSYINSGRNYLNNIGDGSQQAQSAPQNIVLNIAINSASNNPQDIARELFSEISRRGI